MESEYINWLAAEVRRRERLPGGRIVPLGIGDDAAIVDTASQTVCCADLLAEGTHFVLGEAVNLEHVGRKALAVNLSDMAAMGACGETALLSLLVNRKNGLHQAQAVTRGLLDLADEFQVALVGGDTCSWNGGLVVNVTVQGTLLTPQPLLRSGARPGDLILVTGELGGSILRHHWEFTPRCRAIDVILRTSSVHATTDISDGLVRDLSHVATASSVGALLFADRIPVSAAARHMESQSVDQSHLPRWDQWPVGSPGLRHALYDGEDFELLLTMPPESATRLLAQVARGESNIGCALTCIGQITEELGLRITMPNGTVVLPHGGYEH
jgi:thiamine-monophosphate kinase